MRSAGRRSAVLGGAAATALAAVTARSSSAAAASAALGSRCCVAAASPSSSSMAAGVMRPRAFRWGQSMAGWARSMATNASGSGASPASSASAAAGGGRAAARRPAGSPIPQRSTASSPQSSIGSFSPSAAPPSTAAATPAASSPKATASGAAQDRASRDAALKARRAEELARAEAAALDAEPFLTGWRKKGWWTPRRRFYLKVMCVSWPALFAGLLMLYEQQLGGDDNRARYEQAQSERLRAAGRDPQAFGLPRRDANGRRVVSASEVVYFAEVPGDAMELAATRRRPIRFRKEDVPKPLVAPDQGFLAVPERAAPGSLLDLLPPRDAR